MNDIYKPISDDRNGSQPGSGPNDMPQSGNEVTRTLLAGVVGGLLSAAGYVVYSRLPDDQRDKLHQQVRDVVESRITELRSRFNV